MRASKELTGKPVISVGDGRNLGVVKDVYLDENLYWLTGIHMGTEGLFSRKSKLIRRDDIVVFGVDAILVKDADVIRDSNEVEEATKWRRVDKLQGREIDTPGGTKVATIGDVLLDDEARVVGFNLSRVFVEGPVAEKRIVMRDAVIDSGNEDGVMTIDLAKAEKQRVDPDKELP